MSWIIHPLQLEDTHVALIPLAPDHLAPLIDAARHPDIWTWYAFDGTDPQQLIAHYEEAFRERDKGAHYPFAVYDKIGQRFIGSTRYLKISPEHRSLEIGWTWYNPAYWSKGYNEACKLLLLRHAFEQLDAVRVQLIAWEQNQRSRKAILRIGAQFEGILRHSAIRKEVPRNVAYYSILPEEWPAVRQRLGTLIAQRTENITT